MIRVYFSKFSQQLSEELFKEYLNLIPKDLQTKALKYVRWQDRQAYLFGKLLLQRALREFNYNLSDVEDTYNLIKKDVSQKIMNYYKTKIIYKKEDNSIEEKYVDVLYYFWVKYVECPKCKEEIDLFSDRIFIKNAYPSKKPDAKALCPDCGAVNSIKVFDKEVICDICGHTYDPNNGAIKRNTVTCPTATS